MSQTTDKGIFYNFNRNVYKSRKSCPGKEMAACFTINFDGIFYVRLVCPQILMGNKVMFLLVYKK